MEDEIVSGKPLPPKVTAVEARDDWKLQLTFTGGQERIFDMKPYRYGVFARLEEPDYFERVRIVDGSICWPLGFFFSSCSSSALGGAPTAEGEAMSNVLSSRGCYQSSMGGVRYRWRYGRK